MLFTLSFFILALFILVVFHEFGHFIVARYFGVKVLRFSFGFGPALLKWSDRRGTQYVWSLIPLGGYVKLLDESVEKVAASERHMALNRASLWARISIVSAGPVFNFFLAFVFLWVVFVVGIQTIAPIAGKVISGSPFAKAGLKSGDEIIAVDSTPVRSWRDFYFVMTRHIGSGETIPIQVQLPGKGQLPHAIQLSLDNSFFESRSQDLLKNLGVRPYVPSIPPVIGQIVPDSPASKSNLKTGDKIIQVNQDSIKDWVELVAWVREHPGDIVSVLVRRDGVEQTYKVNIGKKKQDGDVVGFLGLKPKPIELPPNWLRIQRSSPVAALGDAWLQTGTLIKTTFVLIGRMLTGNLSFQSVSGPVGIAQGAGDSARAGVVQYLSFLALLSISLGVLNLLPIPMLDGGHLLFYFVEAVMGRPLSNRVRARAIYFGILVLFFLTGVALTNDIGRLFNY